MTAEELAASAKRDPAPPSGISDEALANLRARGHQIVRARGSFGGYQGILIDPTQKVLHGASEARKDGAAVGY